MMSGEFLYPVANASRSPRFQSTACLFSIARIASFSPDWVAWAEANGAFGSNSKKVATARGSRVNERMVGSRQTYWVARMTSLKYSYGHGFRQDTNCARRVYARLPRLMRCARHRR